MSAAREHILDRIRGALRANRLPDATPSHPGSFSGDPEAPHRGDARLAARFSEELEAQGGVVYRATSDRDAARVALRIMADVGATRVLSWDERWLGCPGFLSVLGEAGIQITHVDLASDTSMRRSQLDEIETAGVGLTGAVAGLADTGSLVLPSGHGRSRAASLLPPVHIAILSSARVYPSLPAFLTADPDSVTSGSTLVCITGPSRTADIEMTLTHGVHGPRELHVIVVP